MSIPCTQCGRESEYSCICGPCEACYCYLPLGRDGLCYRHTEVPDDLENEA